MSFDLQLEAAPCAAAASLRSAADADRTAVQPCIC